MFSKNQNSLWIGIGLMLAVLLTRTGHFGTAVHLPDATLAVLFLGGLLRFNLRWLAATIALAVAVDFYAVGVAGVSDYCMSVGYWGLIPTYAFVWAAGRFTSKRPQASELTTLVPAAWLTVSAAFIMSNAFWYAFSDKVSTLSIYQFTQAVAQYYVPYLGYSMFYLGVAWATYACLNSMVFNKDRIA